MCGTPGIHAVSDQDDSVKAVIICIFCLCFAHNNAIISRAEKTHGRGVEAAFQSRRNAKIKRPGLNKAEAFAAYFLEYHNFLVGNHAFGRHFNFNHIAIVRQIGGLTHRHISAHSANAVQHCVRHERHHFSANRAPC